jgi:hypothetical protein
LMTRRAIGAQRSTRPPAAARIPSLAFGSSDLPVKNLDRPKWPEAATGASAIQAADWQPKMCGIIRELRLGSQALTAIDGA